MPISELILDRKDCCAIEASYLLVYHKTIDVTMPLVIFQFGVVGEATFDPHGSNLKIGVLIEKQIGLLVEKLRQFYPATHRVCIYEAAVFSISKPRCERRNLDDIATSEPTSMSTLFIPALRPPNRDVYFAQKFAALNSRLGGEPEVP